MVDIEQQRLLLTNTACCFTANSTFNEYKEYTVVIKYNEHIKQEHNDINIQSCASLSHGSFSAPFSFSQLTVTL